VTDVIDERTVTTEVVVPSVDVAPESQSVGWRHRHLLDVDGLSIDDIDLVMRTADAMREVLARPIAKVPALRGRNVTIVFYEASTRTRVSFEVAMRQLGGETIYLSAADSQLGRGETVADTARVLSRYVDAIMIRTNQPRKLDDLARYATVPVINGLTDTSHPCQIMSPPAGFTRRYVSASHCGSLARRSSARRSGSSIGRAAKGAASN
jgi:ornithine carbamoyltransferase